MPRQWTWFYPEGAKQVVELLDEHGDHAVLVAGSTSLTISPPTRDAVMIDLGKAKMDRIVVQDDKVVIGATVTADALVRSEALEVVGSGMLREAGSRVGPQPARNRITVAGNVMRAYPWCDLPAPLLALGARFELRSARGSRIVDAAELLASQPRTVLGSGEIINAITVPVDEPGVGGAFIKHSQTEIEHALVSAAALVRLDAGRQKCTELVVTVGALTPLPQKLVAVSDQLKGTELSDEAIAKATADLDVKVASDRRADPDHRRRVAAVIVRRAIVAARDRARAGGGA